MTAAAPRARSQGSGDHRLGARVTRQPDEVAAPPQPQQMTPTLAADAAAAAPLTESGENSAQPGPPAPPGPPDVAASSAPTDTPLAAAPPPPGPGLIDASLGAGPLPAPPPPQPTAARQPHPGDPASALHLDPSETTGADASGAPASGTAAARVLSASRLPLRARLPLIFTALLLAALAITAIGTRLALGSYLLSQVDDQLIVAANTQFARTISSQMMQGQPSLAPPTDYAMRLLDNDGDVLVSTTPMNTSSAQAPDFPNDSVAAAAARNKEPFTVRSNDGSVAWRVISFPVDIATANGATVTTGVGQIALSLDRVQETLMRVNMIFIIAGVVLAALGAAASYWAVRRSLRPLREVEAVAADIAAGDLSQRVPAAPRGTEVGELSDSLNSMLTQIEHSFDVQARSEARMRQFVSDASHELRTPLAAIRGYGELYRMGALADPDELRGAMRRIEDEAARMGSLVGDLLQLTRLDEGAPLRHDRVDLVTLADDAAADLRALDPGRPVTVQAPDEVTITGDADRLRQVLANLIGNAARYTPPGTPVEITVSDAGPQPDAPAATTVPGGPGAAVSPGEAGAAGARPKGTAVLRVIDHGPGISGADAQRVFERFTRLDTSRTRTSGGAGLGLAIVASIAAAHGGAVTLDATPGGGATFTLTLPLETPAG